MCTCIFILKPRLLLLRKKSYVILSFNVTLNQCVYCLKKNKGLVIFRSQKNKIKMFIKRVNDKLKWIQWIKRVILK